MRIRIAGFLAFAIGSLALAACGGSTPAFYAQIPSSQSTSGPVTTAGGSLSVGSIGSGSTVIISSAGVTFPALTSAGTASLTLSAAGPSGVPSPDALRRDSLGVPANAVAYVTLEFAQTEAITKTPSFTIAVPSGSLPAGNAYVVAYSSGLANGWSELAGPVTTGSGALTFPSVTLPAALQLQANVPYVFALVTTGSSTIASATTAASYSGTKTVSYVYGFDFAYPTPGPTATAPPPANLSYAVTANVSIGSSPNPVASAGGVDVHTSESDVGNLSTATLGTDSWIGNTTNNGSIGVVLYAQTQTEPSSADEPVITTAYATPQLIDQLPETTASWNTNSSASTVTYQYANGDNGTRVVQSNGTYVDTENVLSNNGEVVLTENADGSGSITGAPSPAPTSLPIYSGGFVTSITMSAPVPTASPYVNVALNFTAFAQANYNEPAQQVIPVPLWYPAQPVFYTETDTITTGATLPSGCSSVGTSANDVKRIITTLDTVLGFVETTTLDTYVSNNLPVCLNTNDVLNYAYDFQNNTPYLFLVGPLGTEIVTTTETLALKSGTSGAIPASKVAAALQSHQLASFARARSELIRSIIANGAKLRSAVHTGGR
jgi:hypothetical protein